MLRPPGYRPPPAAPSARPAPTSGSATKKPATASTKQASTADGFQAAKAPSTAVTNLVGGMTISMLPKFGTSHAAAMELIGEGGKCRKLTDRDMQAMLPTELKDKFNAMSPEDKAQFMTELQDKMPKLVNSAVARDFILDWCWSQLGATRKPDLKGYEEFTGE